MISYVDAVSCTGQESTRKCYSQILCGVDLTFVFVCTNKNTIQWAWFGFVLKKTCVCVCVSPLAEVVGQHQVPCLVPPPPPATTTSLPATTACSAQCTSVEHEDQGSLWGHDLWFQHLWYLRSWSIRWERVCQDVCQLTGYVCWQRLTIWLCVDSVWFSWQWIRCGNCLHKGKFPWHWNWLSAGKKNCHRGLGDWEGRINDFLQGKRIVTGV